MNRLNKLLFFPFSFGDNSDNETSEPEKKDTVFPEYMPDYMKDFILQHRLCDKSAIINFFKDKSGE